MIGLLPAAGRATRIQGLPKFLLPIPDGYLLKRHIDSMKTAGSEQVYIGASENTHSILSEYTPGARVYLAQECETMSQTVLSGYGLIHADGYYPFTLFGMPDSYLPDYTYPRLLSSLHDGAQVAVAVFPAREGQHQRGGMCQLEGRRVVSVIDKPQETDLTWIWGALAWTHAFWEFIKPQDAHVGYALPRAIEAGLHVRAVKSNEPYFDCGTVNEYFELVQHLNGVPA